MHDYGGMLAAMEEMISVEALLSQRRQARPMKYQSFVCHHTADQHVTCIKSVCCFDIEQPAHIHSTNKPFSGSLNNLQMI